MSSLVQIAVLVFAAAMAEPDEPDASPCGTASDTAQVNDCFTAAIETQDTEIAAKAAALRAQLLAEQSDNPAPGGVKSFGASAKDVDNLMARYHDYFDAKCNLVASGDAGGSVVSNAYNACIYDEQKDLIDFLDSQTETEDGPSPTP